MLINKLGGVNETDKLALRRAKDSDLITLPKDISGTNCYNCKWIASHKMKEAALCTNERVRQYVNERMCCSLWSAPGEYRLFKQDEKYK